MGKPFRPKYISFSALSLYENCPRCYFLQYKMGCYPEGKDAWKFGSAYHEGLAAHYDGKPFIEGFRNGLRYQFVTGPLAMRFQSMAMIMFDHYQTFGDKYEADKIEYRFQCPLINPITNEVLPVPIHGVMDLLTKDYAILDHKTSSQLYAENCDIRQLYIYSMVYRKLFDRSPSRLGFSVHIKNDKTGKWQGLYFNPDPMAEAIEFQKIKVLLNGILAGEFEPKKTNNWLFTHLSLCPEYVVPRRKKS